MLDICDVVPMLVYMDATKNTNKGDNMKYMATIEKISTFLANIDNHAIDFDGYRIRAKSGTFRVFRPNIYGNPSLYRGSDVRTAVTIFVQDSGYRVNA